jgi:VanZ family protein
MSRRVRWILAIGWTLIIVAACSIPGSDLPEIDIDWIDKVAHVSLFLVLAWLWLDATEGPVPRRILWVVVLGSVFGVLTEFYQGILPWERSPDVLDALANTAGLIAGSAAFAAWKGRFFSSGSNL